MILAMHLLSPNVVVPHALFACLLGGFGPSPVQDRGHPTWKPKMNFALAHKPFKKLDHSICGYVDDSGRILNRGLAPSSYVSVVLHRMRFGNAWLEKYNIKVHQWRGDQIAAYFGFRHARVLDAARILDARQTGAFVDQGLLRSHGLYLFHVMGEGRSHVGFVRVGPEGSLVQSHYSGLRLYGRHAGGDFRRWYRASPFRGKPVQLFYIRPVAPGREVR